MKNTAQYKWKSIQNFPRYAHLSFHELIVNHVNPQNSEHHFELMTSFNTNEMQIMHKSRSDVKSLHPFVLVRFEEITTVFLVKSNPAVLSCQICPRNADALQRNSKIRMETNPSRLRNFRSSSFFETVLSSQNFMRVNAD